MFLFCQSESKVQKLGRYVLPPEKSQHNVEAASCILGKRWPSVQQQRVLMEEGGSAGDMTQLDWSTQDSRYAHRSAAAESHARRPLPLQLLLKELFLSPPALRFGFRAFCGGLLALQCSRTTGFRSLQQEKQPRTLAARPAHHLLVRSPLPVLERSSCLYGDPES